MRILVLRRHILAGIGVALAAGLIFKLAGDPKVVGAAVTNRQLPVYCVQADYPVASLSFDAAWGNEDTQTLIDILDKYQVQATFFVVGDWVEKYPESVKALHDAGHEIMSHSDTHAHFNALTPQEIQADLTACGEKIQDITGEFPTLFRCPYGEYDDHVITTVRSMGIQPVQWDVDSLDWKEISASEIIQRVTSRVGPGSIVLFHNAALHTPEALPAIIETLLQEGYTLLPISQLLLSGEYGEDYTIDHAGRQCPVE